MEKLAELLSRRNARGVPERERSPHAEVIAVLELRDSRRRWFVTGVEGAGDQRTLIGYEPRCRYGTAGDGWFALSADFFVDAALVSQDDLDVHTLTSRATVAELDIDDRF